MHRQQRRGDQQIDDVGGALLLARRLRRRDRKRRGVGGQARARQAPERCGREQRCGGVKHQQRRQHGGSSQAARMAAHRLGAVDPVAQVMLPERRERAARDVVRAVFAKSNPLLVEKRDGNVLQFEMLMPAKDMNEATLHETRGDSLFARKMYEEAVVEYTKGIAIDRYNASTLNRLGLVYHQMQNFDEAERHYQEALKQNPYFVEVLNNIGTIEYGRKRYDRALAQYKKALNLHPESATIYLNMGACLFDMKRYDEATKATQRALELDPKVLDRAASGFGTLIQTSRRSDPTVSYYFAKLYAARGDKELAISYLNRALDEGFKEFDKIKTEPSFAALAQQEGFIKIMDRVAELSAADAPR